MALEALRRWRRTQFPIPPPGIAEIQVQGVVDDFGASHLAAEISIPMLDRGAVSSDLNVELLTQVSQDLLHLQIPAVSIDLALRAHTPETLALPVPPIQPPTIHEPSFAGFIEYPAIIEPFEALAYSGCTGRTYQTQEEASSKGRLVQQGMQELDRAICRHGLERDVCAICTKDTVKERLRALLTERQQLFDRVIDDLSADYVQGKTTDEELFRLFDLELPAHLRRKPQAQDANVPSLGSETEPSDTGHWEFEQLVAGLYGQMGFKTKVTPQTRDHGVNIIAGKPSDFGVDYWIIQCKHHPNGTVGEAEVRAFWGAWQKHHKATHAVIVTSGRFSDGAVRLAERHNIRLMDRIILEKLLREYGP